MIDIVNGIDSLSNFKRDSSRFLEALSESGKPVVLTVNGRAKVVVQDAASYQNLLDYIEQIETVIGIRKGLRDVRQGKTVSIEDLSNEMK